MMEPSIQEVNALAVEIHEANHKWWHDLVTGERLERNVGEMCMLIVSELAEAMEGARKGLMDDHLPHRKMEEVEMADAVIRILDLAGAYEVTIKPCEFFPWRDSDNVGEALHNLVQEVNFLKMAVNSRRVTDPGIDFGIVLWKIEDYCAWRELDLWAAVEEKRAYNKTRRDHTVEARLAEGGKKW